MAIVYKCKCCAGNLDVEVGMRLIKCPACRTKQTLPSSRDENIQNLFNRATTLRLKCEFDKAETVYERIIQADEEQYEAYWGLILCKFGVEYVEDPKTDTRIPTCHRTSFESIIADENYKLALKYALDDEQQAVYKEEAGEIDKIQKGILAVAQNEEPYDVFICYKETDESGKRTQDSVIANDIYHQLTQEGFKVFYAAITLEGKLGSAYEPIIFAALNSAKVMLAVGTKPEYFNAVWVKNEWSRFLKMNKEDRNKLLIPCYKDMDPYDLPDEFAHLQAQDMGKIGFITDLIRGVKKVLEKKKERRPQTTKTTVDSSFAEGMLTRAKNALEGLEYGQADAFADQVIKSAELCNDKFIWAEGHLIKFLCWFKSPNLQLASLSVEKTFKGQRNLGFAKMYADESLRADIDEFELSWLCNRIEKGLIDLKNDKLYVETVTTLEQSANNERAKKILDGLQYKRDQQLYAEAKGILLKEDLNINDYFQRIKTEEFKTLLSQDLINMRKRIRDKQNELVYREAERLMKVELKYDEAHKKFLSIGKYKDAPELAKKCYIMAIDKEILSIQTLKRRAIKDANKSGAYCWLMIWGISTGVLMFLSLFNIGATSPIYMIVLISIWVAIVLVFPLIPIVNFIRYEKDAKQRIKVLENKKKLYLQQ